MAICFVSVLTITPRMSPGSVSPSAMYMNLTARLPGLLMLLSRETSAICWMAVSSYGPEAGGEGREVMKKKGRALLLCGLTYLQSDLLIPTLCLYPTNVTSDGIDLLGKQRPKAIEHEPLGLGMLAARDRLLVVP